MGPRNLHFTILFWLDVARTTLWETLLVAVGMVICWISKVKMRSGNLILEEPLLNLFFIHFWYFMQKKPNEIQIWEIECFIRGSSRNFSCEWEKEKERASTKIRKVKKTAHICYHSQDSNSKGLCLLVLFVYPVHYGLRHLLDYFLRSSIRSLKGIHREYL